MANPLRGEASFEADGQTYTITMNADALVMAETVTGHPISAIVGQFDSGAHLGMTSALAWAGMSRQYGFPYADFAEKVLGWGLPVVRAAVAAAMRDAWPEKEAEPENPPKRGRTKKAAGTG